MQQKPLFAYFGHHKCATAWINAIVSKCCEIIGLNHIYIHSPRQFDMDLNSFIDKNKIDFFSYANADFGYVQSLDGLKAFHVVRDPRDITVSAYFSHLYSHPTSEWPKLVDHREKLSKVSKEEGLFIEMEFLKEVFWHLRTWDYAQPVVLEIKMEELTGYPYEKFVEIFDFLGLLKSITLEKLLAVVYRHRFSALSEGRKKGDEDEKSHFRKGTSGDWENHFCESHKEYFKEKHNDLLIQLKYEVGDDW